MYKAYSINVATTEPKICCALFYIPTTEPKLCDNQPDTLHLPGMDRAALHGIYACRIDVGVAQNISQAGQILFKGVVGPGEQMAQVVRKYLFRFYICTFTQGFHITPNIRTIERFSRPGDKNGSGCSFFLFSGTFSAACTACRAEKWYGACPCC